MGGKKDKKKGNKAAEATGTEEPPQEVAQMEEAKPKEGGDSPQQPDVTAGEPKAEPATPKEAVEDPKEVSAPVPVPNKETGVNGLLVELLSASHDAIDGYQQLNKDKVVQSSKVFESNVPKILVDFAELSGFNEETKTKLKEYLTRAQQTDFIEKLDELTSKSKPKVKDLVVDETNLDELVGKIVDFTGTSLKKNLNEQLKRLEETELFRAYLETKPKPQAPEVALLVEERTKTAALENALKSLQTLYVQTSEQMQAVWEHRQEDLGDLQTVRKGFLNGVKNLPQEIQTVVAEALQETEKSVLVDLSQSSRPQAARLKELLTELDKTREEFKSKEEKLEKTNLENSNLLNGIRIELDSAKQSLTQEISKAEEDKRQLTEHAQKLQEAEQKLKLVEEASKQLADQSEVTAKQLQTEKEAAEQALQKVESELKETKSSIETLKDSVTKVVSLQAELDRLKLTISDLSEKLVTEQRTVKDLTTKLTSAEASITKQTSEIEQLSTEITTLREKHTQLEAAHARLQISAANNDELLKQVDSLTVQITAKNLEVSRLNDVNTKQVEDHHAELEGLRTAMAPLGQKITDLQEEMRRITEENNRLTSELDQERLRSSTLTGSKFSEQIDGLAVELEEAVVVSNQSALGQPDEANQPVDVAPGLSVPQPSQDASPADPSDPPVREGDIPDQSPTETQAVVDLTVETLRLQEEIRLKESEVTAARQEVQETKSRLQVAEADVLTLRSAKDDLSARLEDLETSVVTYKSEVSKLTSELLSASQAQEQLKSQIQLQADTTEKEKEVLAQLDAAKVAHTQDLKTLTDAKVSFEGQLDGLKHQLEQVGLEKSKLESQLSQEQQTVHNLTQQLSAMTAATELAANTPTTPLKPQANQEGLDDEATSEHQQNQTSSPRMIQKLEHRIKQLEEERDTYKLGQDIQAKVVQEKDEGLVKIKTLFEHARSNIIELQQKLDAVNSAYEGEKEKYQKLRTKYDDLKRKYSLKSSGASTPGHHLAAGDVRSSRQSVGPRIEEAVEADLDVSDQAKMDLNEAAQTQVAQLENPAPPAPFDVQKTLVETLFSSLQKLLRSVAISKDESKLYLPVTADERSTIDSLMLEVSKHWQSQRPQVPQEQPTLEPELTEDEQPQTVVDVFDTLREKNEMLTEQKQSLSTAVEQLLNPLRPLITKILGKQGLQPLEDCFTVSMISEEIQHILKGTFSSKLDEIIASESTMKKESERLQKELAVSEKKSSELELKLQENQRPLDKLLRLVRLLSEPRKTFREQNPLTILEKATGIAETSPVSVDVWKGGLATGVAHVIKDLLRRILALVPELHTANPKRNAPWINHLLDTMEGVSHETDEVVKSFRTAGNTQGLEEFLGRMQVVVCRAGQTANNRN